MQNNIKLKKLIIDIQVRNLSRAIEFYANILGLKIIHREDEWASFEAMGAEIHLYLHGGTEYGLEFRVTQIENKVTALKEKGIQFHPNVKAANLIRIENEIMIFPWGKTASFKDSEGNVISIVDDEITLPNNRKSSKVNL